MGMLIDSELTSGCCSGGRLLLTEGSSEEGS